MAGEKETAGRGSNAALAAVMPHAAARFVSGLGHGWLGTRMDLHVDMTFEWLTRQEVPSGLVVEAHRPDAVRQLLRELESAERGSAN